ncbi:MAG: heparinase II/III family protein [Bacteroidota bacterium]|nr:heparinase II/III family protein [Bacteroidota bacterium]
MIRIAFFFLFAWSVNVSATDYEPYTYRQDFELGEVAAWSSYPPTQDTAYDPFLYPGKITDSDTGTSLCKLYNPSWNEPQLVGMAKQLAMRLDKESRITFRYFIKTTNTPSWLGIDLGLTNGDRIRTHYTSIKINRWDSISLDLSDILRLADREPVAHLDITAIALTVRFEKSDPDMPIYIAIDDVEIKGKAAVAFKYEIPETEKLAEWEPEIALNHYKQGDRLEISGTFLPSKPDKVNVSINRFDNPGREIIHYYLASSGDSWKTRNKVELDNKRFPAGMYIVTLTGTKREKIVARSTFTFLVVEKKRYSGHPRLWFDKNGREDFITRVLTEQFEPVLKDIRKKATEARKNFPGPEIPYDLDRFHSEKDWLPTLGIYINKINGIAQGALNNALVSLIDNDTEAAAYARAVLLSMCKWKSWQHPWILDRGQHTYYPVGYTGRDLALVFDLLYDNLTPSERKLVADAFMKNNVIPAYKGYVINNLVTSHGSNWVPRITGGALMCMLSIIDEFEDSSQLEPYLSGILYKHKAVLDEAFGRDGGYGEGFAYYGATVAAFCRSMPTLERCLGLDMSENLDRSYTEIFWASDPDNNRYYTFGDAGIHHGPAAEMTDFPWLIKKYRDPNLAWLYKLYYTSQYGKDRHSVYEVLYDISDIPAERPTGLKGAKWFRDIGTVVFRSGDEQDPFIFTFRCGPFANHQHLDQGTFYLADRGKVILTEQGYSAYYSDPLYQSHIIQPVSHNCILIDHNPRSQRTGDHLKYARGFEDYAQVTDFVKGETLAFTLGNLAPVYLGNVKELERGILYLHPRTVLIIDKFKTKNGEALMDVLFHSPKYSNTSILNNTFTIHSGTRQFTGTVISTSNAVISIEADPLKLNKFTKEPLEPLGRITVTTETSDGTALSAILLATESPDETNITDERIFLNLKDANVLINKKGGTVSGDSISSDGFLVAASKYGAVACVDGTFCSIDGNTVFTSNVPMTVLIETGSVSYSAGTKAVIKFLHRDKIRSLIMNGKKVTNWKTDSVSGLVSVEIPAGQGSIVFK